MIKLIKYVTLCSTLAFATSCGDQLRLEEREASFNKDYFTYSRYQLTTSIVSVAKIYGKAATDAPRGQAAMYFMDCYSGDQIPAFYTKTDPNWLYQDKNVYAGSGDEDGQLRTLEAVKKLATTEGNMANVAAADILKCVVGAYLTEKYGDIPFTEAVQGRTGDLFPKFDSQKMVYETMFAMLSNAVAILSDANSKGLPAESDVLFKGDKTKWIKFANSLKFRLMVHSYDAFKKAGKDLAADMQAIAGSTNYMSAVADNAGLTFPGTVEKDAWYMQRTWGTGNTFTEQKPSKYLIDQMVAFDDPRMYVIFAPVLSPLSSKPAKVDEVVKINGFSYTINHYPATAAEAAALTAAGRDLNGNVTSVPYVLDAKWFGTPNPTNVQAQYGGTGLTGSNGFYDNRRLTGFSTLLAKVADPRLKAVLMEADEMAFLLAEARQKGWISAGTVKGHYENGIKLSFQRWQIEDGTKPATHIGSDKIVDDFTAYYAKPGVALDGTAADLDKIATQKWLSMLITNQNEAYTDYRRTGKPAFIGKIAPSFGSYTYPQRYMYPLDEASNNKENYNAAVSALGGKDIASAKMWILN
ncbi:SusD/RagB family nutrient-binding outer membrane lipoprotein [Dyadobacter sp. 32]|uniref:SusD/RagB family nutrient-binding outer membrane lipoprotein n=1 Tax=Dyadobacter sp. 32 TaxID=538966 RepID=UPI0039C6CA0A